MTDAELEAAWQTIPTTYRYSINGERYIELLRGSPGDTYRGLVPFNAKTFAEWCEKLVDEHYDASAKAAQRIADAKEGFGE